MIGIFHFLILPYIFNFIVLVLLKYNEISTDKGLLLFMLILSPVTMYTLILIMIDDIMKWLIK